MASIQTQSQIAEQMVAQIRLLKPSISAEVGTPERLILDTVANAIAESSIDLIGLQEALNVDTKFGSNLTNFLALFGFARQEATTATGFVIFSRNSPANVDTLIPSGTILRSQTLSGDGNIAEFETTAAVTLPTGGLETPPAPIRALASGSNGNVAANSITIMTLAPVLGITSVTNPFATSGGADQENDNSLKVRFKNTVFRNMAGTEDQFLALAVATAFSTKAIVVGPVSKYQEYVQVPQDPQNAFSGDDTTEYFFGGQTKYTGTPSPVIIRGSSKAGNAKIFQVKSTAGVSAGQLVKIYEGVDNPRLTTTGTVAAVLNGTEIELSEESKPAVTNGWGLFGDPSAEKAKLANQWTTALSDNPFAKEIWTGLPVFISDAQSGISKFFFREGVDFKFNYPAKLQGDTLRALIDGTGADPRTDFQGKNQPNITFTNVYLGTNEAIKAIGPGDIVLVEYSYTSSSSRNSIQHNVTNAVDVFVDGENQQPTETIFTAPLPATQQFKDDPTSAYYYENYRRDGEPTKRPLEGNVLTPLFQVPVLKLPTQINVGANKYYLGVHYWLVHDVSNYGGTIRARDGIEWSNTIGADLGGPSEGIPNANRTEPTYKGAIFSALSNGTLVEISQYFYDQNIEDLQAALESARQVTTDTLAHRARTRYFKLDITVIYSPQATVATVNGAIHDVLEKFLANQYFGSVIRLSDLLQVIHNVSGVENVRWSNDTPHNENLIRIFETDNNGLPLRGIFSDRFQWGSGTAAEIQTLYIVGQPTSGTFRLRYGTAPGLKETIALNAATVTAAELQAAIRTALAEVSGVIVEEDVRSVTNVISPIRSFRVAFQPFGVHELPVVVYNVEQPITGGEYIYDTDFFVRDNELPALPEKALATDTAPGLIIRSRAQNVWQKA